MEYNNKLSRCADMMKNTYVQKDMNLRLSLFNGRNDPEPKRCATSFSIKFNLMEAAVLGVGVLAFAFTLHKYRQKACEARLMKKLAGENREDKYPEEKEEKGNF